MTTKKIVVVGGGITGLSAAYYLKKEIEQGNLPFEVTLMEASHRLGGKIKTMYKDGFVLERGPDSFLERKKPAVKLVESLGLTDQLVRNSTGQAHILVGETLYKIPQGFHMGIPVYEQSLEDTDLISDEGKDRVKMDLTLPKGEATTDQSLGHFLRHRFGNELVENFIEPLLSGIYSSDMDEMSLMASFPQFYQLEQAYGSLMKGLQDTLPAQQASTGKRKGQFLSFQNGLETLVNELTKQLGEDTFMMETKVERVERDYDSSYQLFLNNGEVYQADAVIMTTPHDVLPGMFEQYKLFEPLKSIPKSSVANVVLAFDESALEGTLDGTGFVVSRNSDVNITACTWTHRKWPSTTPEGKVLLRAYVGKPTDQKVVDLSDEEIVKIVLKDLAKVMHITAAPEFTMVTRWKDAMPQYTIGHVETIKKVRTDLMEQLPGVCIAGSSFEGVGIPDCIAQGETAVDHVLQFLKK